VRFNTTNTPLVMACWWYSP